MTDVAKVPANLADLQLKAAEQFKSLSGCQYGSKEYNDAKLALYQTEQLIKGALAAQAKEEAEKKIAMEREKQITLRVNYRAAVLANTGKNANDATAKAEQEAADAIDNQLLAKYAKPAAVKSDGQTAGTRGATSAEIHSKLLAYINGGMTSTEAVKAVIAEGFSRGTTGAVRTQMVKDGEIAA